MLKPILYTLLIALSFTSCKSDNASGPEETDTSTATAPAAAPDEPADASSSEIRYTWVDQLNVRDQPSTKGKVVARVKPNEPLTLTGETSATSETIVLRGVAYDEPWYRITTTDKKDGWVFGGAVKKEDEFKGNKPRRKDELDFPVFGVFKLSEWEKLANASEEGGDASIVKESYRAPNGQLLEIELTEIGEYGYSEEYRLKDKEGNTLKQRRLIFDTDPSMLLTEDVIDYTDIPAKRYVRYQKMTKHFLQLNERPQLVRGEWQTERVD